MQTNNTVKPEKCALKSAHGWNIPVDYNRIEDPRMILLCLHGFGGDKGSSVIEKLRERLGEKGILVISFDWPQHGESGAPDCSLTAERCLDDLQTVLNWLTRGRELPVACFATSFGGYLATLYRNAHPEVFSELILRSPALKAGKVICGITPADGPERIARGESVGLGKSQDIIVGREFYDSLLANDAYTPAPPHPENMMIMQGNADEIVCPEDTRLYAEKNGIRLVMFEGTDHFYKKDGEPERIVAETEGFLLRPGRSPRSSS